VIHDKNENNLGRVYLIVVIFLIKFKIIFSFSHIFTILFERLFVILFYYFFVEDKEKKIKFCY